MLPYRDSRLVTIAIVVFFVLVAGYAYFEARGILFGPRITVAEGSSVVHERFISIRGHAERISSLSMNGKEITVTEEGSFDEPYLLAPGENRIIFDAKDRYGRDRQSVIHIVYVPDEVAEATLPTATSTTPTTSTSAPAAATTTVAPAH